MRPGCDRAAVARVAFDPVALQLWLDPLSRDAAPVQELCEFHIERLTIPRGWTATDRRPPTTPAASPAPVAAVGPVEDVPVEDASVGDVPAADVPVEGPAADVSSPGPSTPPAPRRRNQRRDSPSLLSRAFAQAGPQESVLTAGSPDASPVESTSD